VHRKALSYTAILLNLMHSINYAVKSVQSEKSLLYLSFLELRGLGRQCE